jgi:hypothetical protein
MDNKWLWTGKPWQAFKTFALFFSFALNLIMLIILLAAAPLIIPIVADIARPIVGGLNNSFVDMGDATIEQSIQVDDTLDIDFTVPFSTTTRVVITEEVPLEGVPARFVLPGGGGVINGQVYLDLPEGQELPIQLEIEVPIKQTIPVKLDVPIEIPLNETELGGPFNALQALFEPLDELLHGLPSSNDELIDRILNSDGTTGEELQSASLP